MVGRSSDDTDGKSYSKREVESPAQRTRTKRDIVRFSDQVICNRYAGPGDSGSAILNARNEVIGLHTSGSMSASIFNKIEHVFSLLKITLA